MECSSGKNDRNIAYRVNLGVGAISQIFSTLRQVSLGHYFYDMALVFRDATLISKLVSSSEVWYGVTKQEYKRLENIESDFL